jgi:hypothetical protein
MTTFVLRVRLPDRPGALGAVTSRIGAVRGDVVGFEIVDRDEGRAVDDIVVSLDEAHLELLLAEIAQVDDAEVLEVLRASDDTFDPRLDSLQTALEVVTAGSVHAVLVALCDHAARTIGASFAAVVDVDDETVTSSEDAPEFRLSISLPSAGQALVLARDDQPFRDRERQAAALLAEIADAHCRTITH